MSTNTSYERIASKDAVSERSSAFGNRAADNDDIPLVDYNGENRLPGRPRRHGQTLRAVLTWWLPEILASFFSVATFVSIVVVLRIYNGKPLTDLHLPAYLTLNGIIAALATLNRAFLVAPVGSAIMQEVWLSFAAEGAKPNPSSRLQDLEVYDSASRGAFGSLALLFRIRGRRLLACLGALITILSLAFGTFAQQLITYDRMVPAQNGSALAPGNIPRTETWEKFVGNPAEGGESASSPPFDMVAAFYSGVLSGGIMPLTASCPSGNCTWPLTPSLAVCGGCVNQTPEPPVCFDACYTDYMIDVDPQYVLANCTKIPNLYCNYTMPSGSVATLFNFQNKTLMEGSSGAFPGFQALASTGAYYNLTKEDRLYLANFDLFGAQYDSYSLSVSNTTYTATECALWFCVETYNTSFRSNGQTQEVTSTVGELNATTFQFPPLGPSAADPNNKTSFSITDSVAYYVIQMWTSATIPGAVALNMESQEFSSDLMKGIWNGTNDTDAWISNIATSLTNVVRSTNQTSRAEYNGTAYQLGVSVRWVWLSLPAALVVLSMALFVTVMIRTALSPVAPWKGSPLTLLLFDVDPAAKEASYGQAEKYNGIQNAVGSMTVRLSEEPGRMWKFKAS